MGRAIANWLERRTPEKLGRNLGHNLAVRQRAANAAGDLDVTLQHWVHIAVRLADVRPARDDPGWKQVVPKCRLVPDRHASSHVSVEQRFDDRIVPSLGFASATATYRLSGGLAGF